MLDCTQIAISYYLYALINRFVVIYSYLYCYVEHRLCNTIRYNKNCLIAFSYLPEFGLSLYSKNKVRPTFGVRSQLPETLSQKRIGLPLQPPTRTRSARVRCFSFFAFTSSPYDGKTLGNSDLRVKVSPLFPSPVKAKKEHSLHAQRTLYQRLAGEGEG